MRRDFHYYALYTIALWAGLKPEIAKVMAYASEHVDDAKLADVLSIKGGGQYQPIASAHPIFHPNFFKDETALAIYAPFHFFPQLEGSSFEMRMICRPESHGIKALKSHVREMLHTPFGLYYLGISLHVIADTYAHQEFSATRSTNNRIKKLNVSSSGLLDLILPTTGAMFPPIAHLQATTCPDEPACVWSYAHSSKTQVKANNLQRYLDASKSILLWLSHEVRKERPDWFETPSRSFESLQTPLSQLLNLNMLLKDRILAWQMAYDHDLFGPWPLVPYDEHEWQHQAFSFFSPTETSSSEIVLKMDFQNSHWHYFNIALAHHVNFCRYQLFPQYQIYI